MAGKLEKSKIEALKKDAHALKPLVQIGKHGLTPESLIEIQKHLKRKKLIKIKFLKNILDSTDKKELIATLEKSLNAQVISVVGSVCTLYYVPTRHA